MIDAFNVLSSVAARTDCPPDIAAAILWTLDNLTAPEAQLEDDSPKVVATPDHYVRPGRPAGIDYALAERVFREWKALGNIGLAAQKHGVSYNTAWNICRGRTYPEISGRSRLVNQGDGKKRQNLTPDRVREILEASKTKGMAAISEETGIPFATVQSIINRRTMISRQVAGELGMPTIGPNARGPRK